MAAHRRWRPDAALRTARRGRRARGHGRREPAQYSLDAICRRHGLPGKDTALLEEACKAAGFKISKKTPIQSYIWQLPARLCRPLRRDRRGANARSVRNSQADRRAGRHARRLSARGRPAADGAWKCAGAASASIKTPPSKPTISFIGKRDAALKELSDQHGAAVSMAEIQGRKWLEKTFDGYGISYPRTAKGNPSFSTKKSGWMAEHEHWLPRGIAVAKKYNHAGETFIRGHILDHIVNGRIYGEIRPHLSDEGGTISFRFSYSNPPLQQMPKRDDEIGPLIRRRVPAGRGRVLGHGRRQPAGIPRVGALRRAARPAERARGSQGLPQRSRHRLSRAGRRDDRVGPRHGQDRELRQRLRLRRGDVRQDDRQVLRQKRQPSWRNTTPGCRS